MRPIVLRDESPPDAATIVVRGGLLSAGSVQMSLEGCRRQYGFLGLSVYGAVDMTVAELVATVPQISPVRYRQLRLSTFGTVRAEGFPLWPTHVFPHYSIVLPNRDPATLAKLEGCFGPPQLNPALPDS